MQESHKLLGSQNQPIDTKRNAKKRNKPLINPDDEQRSVHLVLNTILEQAPNLPTSTREKLVAARDANWEDFLKSEQARNERIR